MDNILDSLVEYSKREKIVDRAYMSKIVDSVSKEKELDDYIKKVWFAKFKYGHELNTMLYESSSKEIGVDESRINNLCNLSRGHFQKLGLTNFEQFVALNAEISHSLLHEVEHANQRKKSKIDNGDLENLLLAICHHTENEYFNQSKISQFLMRTLGIYLDKEFYSNYVLNESLKEQYPKASPSERMAEIHSISEIQNILKPIKNEMPTVFGLFDVLLSASYLEGYTEQNYYDEILLSTLEGYNAKDYNVGPTQRYLYSFKVLGISGTDSHFNENFYNAMDIVKDSSLENRLTLGLPIKNKEYQKTKSLLPNGLR